MMKFKAFVFGLGLLALGVGQASAQTFNLGLEGGANFSNFIGSDASNITTGNALAAKLGFVGGGFLCLNFGNTFAVRPEILYEQKGAAISGTSTTDEVDYVEIPVLLKFSLGSPGFNPAILLGPSVSFNTASNFVNNGGNAISSSDVGAIGGLEIDIDQFLISGRYELGLENVEKGVDFQNGTITLLIGYSFMK
jgi:hypothetical protein